MNILPNPKHKRKNQIKKEKTKEANDGKKQRKRRDSSTPAKTYKEKLEKKKESDVRKKAKMTKKREKTLWTVDSVFLKSNHLSNGSHCRVIDLLVS